MVSQAHPAPSGGAGLTALLVYRRPTERRELLGQLADLGMFVVEHPHDGGWASMASTAGADIAVVIAGDDDAGLVAELAARPACPVVVCAPDGADQRTYLEAGAHRCVTDSEFGARIPALLADAAAAARAGHDAQLPRSGLTFAEVTFDPGIPSIAMSGHARILSRSECAVLRRLHEAAGYPVEAQELERFATPPGQSMRPGFLKATILRLRRKLREVGADEDTIRTVRGFGYALCLDGNDL